MAFRRWQNLSFEKLGYRIVFTNIDPVSADQTQEVIKFAEETKA